MEQILKRPYKNQKQKDKELMLAYQRGILDERKIWKAVKKENEILKYRERKEKNSYCFCKGDSNWRSMCAECQDWFKKELNKKIKLVIKKYNYNISGGTWVEIEKTILDAEQTRQDKQVRKPKQSSPKEKKR